MNGIGSRWVEIDTDAIVHNLEQIKKLLRPETKIMGVVKANAYGCGAVEVARCLVGQGISMLGVTTVDEGLELRQHGISAPVLIFAPILPQEADDVVANDLTVSVSETEILKPLAEAARERDRKAKVHIKVETGMGRTGILPEEVLSFIRAAVEYSSLIEIDGIYTHLATAGTDPGFAWEQFRRFQRVLEMLEQEGVHIPLKHVCNSAATLLYPEMHLSMVRIGTLLYGQKPPGIKKDELGLKDPWKFKARIIHLREVPPGTSIGYGRDYITREKTRIAVIPVGYADGFTVEPAVRPKGWIDLFKVLIKTILNYWGWLRSPTVVHIGHARARVVGRVGMQLTMIDVGHLPDVRLGDEVEIHVRRTSLNPRLPRVYLRQGRPYVVSSISGITEERREYL